MDAVSYSLASKQAQRIEKFIENPDSTSGIVTVPKVIASGETITIPAGRVAILPNVQVDGTLNVEGDVFIPSGTTLSKVVELEGNQTISDVKTFLDSPLVPTPTTETQAANKAYTDTKVTKVTSTDNAIVRFDGATGAVQNSLATIDDTGKITSIGGVSFSNNDIAGNVLNWYEKGTFTPIIIGTTTDGVGTYTTQVGNYTRIGNVVTFNLYVNISAHTGTGNIRISGLPFKSAAGIGNYTPLSVANVYQLTFTGSFVTAFLIYSSNTIELLQETSNSVSVGIPMDTSFRIMVSGSYKC